MNQEQPIGSDQQGLVSARRRSAARWELKSRVALTWIWRSSITAVSPDEVNEDMRVEWAQSMACGDCWEEELTLLQEEMRRVVHFLAWRSCDWFLKANARAGTTSTLRTGISAYAKKQGSIFRNLSIQFAQGWHSTLLSLKLPRTWAIEFLDKHGAPLVALDPKKQTPKTQSSHQSVTPAGAPPSPSNTEATSHGAKAISDSEDEAESDCSSTHWLE